MVGNRFHPGIFRGDDSEGWKGYRAFAEERLGGEYASPLEGVVASMVLGNPEFVTEVSARKLGKKRDGRNLPAVKELRPRPSLDDILGTVATEALRDEKLLRNVGIYCCRKYSGAKLREIGGRFGISDAAVAQASRRLILRAGKDRELKGERLEAKLGSVRN